MPRAPRYHVPGDLYHVISRGNHRETIFRDDRDFTHYLDLMERYSQRYGVKVHAYALPTMNCSQRELSEKSRGVSRLLPEVLSVALNLRRRFPHLSPSSRSLSA